MAINLSDNIKISAPKPTDYRYLTDVAATYTDVAAVNTAILIGERHIGLTVNVGYSEFWYASGVTNGDLILKTSASGSTINGAQNVGSGAGIYSGVTPTGIINLRSITGSGNTDVSISGDSLIVHSIDSTALQSNILEFSNTGQTFQPYETFTTGVTFYYGNICPTGETRLNLNALLAVTELRLSTGTTHTIHDVGDIYWDNVDGTMSIQQTPDVKQQVGQELFLKAKNSGGTTILNGSVVYVSGSVSGRPTIALARADATDGATIDEIIGLVTEDIPAGQEGFVTTSGLVREINTTGFTEGDIVFLSATVWGGITNVEPEHPNYAIEVGIVTNVDATGGTVYVKIINVSTIQSIRSVQEANITTFSATTRSDFIAAYANRYIYLPLEPRLGQQITIADSNGDASSFTITIYGNGKDISGTGYLTLETQAVINTDWGAITMVYNGTFWNIISSVS